jgi:hypothetical protein
MAYAPVKRANQNGRGIRFQGMMNQRCITLGLQADKDKAKIHGWIKRPSDILSH